jgi:hypothetical protein
METYAREAALDGIVQEQGDITIRITAENFAQK